MQAVQVWFLIGGLRSYMMCGMAKKKILNRKWRRVNIFITYRVFINRFKNIKVLAFCLLTYSHPPNSSPSNAKMSEVESSGASSCSLARLTLLRLAPVLSRLLSLLSPALWAASEPCMHLFLCLECWSPSLPASAPPSKSWSRYPSQGGLFLAAMCGTWNFSSLFTDRIWAPSVEAKSLNHWTTREVPREASPVQSVLSSQGETPPWLLLLFPS